MGALSLAFKDITRHKNRSLLFITIQSLITASGTFFYGLSSSYSKQISSSLNFLNYSIIQVFNGYLSFLLVFSVLTAILVASVLSSLLTISRMKDLATLLSMGGTFKTIQRVPLAQSFLLTLISGFVGWSIGVFGFGCYSLIFGTSLVEVLLSIDIIFMLIYISVQVIGMYFTAGFIVNYIIRKKFKEIIDSEFSATTTVTNHKRIYGISTKGRIGFLLAYLFNKRATISLVVVIGLFILISFSTLGIIGGDIIAKTSDSYVDRGYGSNIHVITTTESFSSLIQTLYDPRNDIIFDSSISNVTNNFPTDFIRKIPINTQYETRYLSVGKIKMAKPIKQIINESAENGPDTVVAGYTRIIDTYFWGIDSSFSLFNYFNDKYDEDFTNLPSESVHIGDGIIQEYAKEDTINMLIPIENNIHRFRIDGILMDPFTRGHCVYMNILELFELKNIQNSDLRNVMFIKDPSEEILTLVNDYNFHSFSLDSLNGKYKAITAKIWISSSIASIPITITAGLSLVAYSGIFARVVIIKDLKILHALGGTPRVLKSVFFWTNIISLRTAPLAILFGYSLAYGLLIPDSIHPSIRAWIILALEFIVIALIVIIYLRNLLFEFYRKF